MLSERVKPQHCVAMLNEMPPYNFRSHLNEGVACSISGLCLVEEMPVISIAAMDAAMDERNITCQGLKSIRADI